MLAAVVAGRRRTSIEWPTEVDDRLRLLADLAARSRLLDGAPSGTELLAAMICEQVLDPDVLARTIGRYRLVEMAELDRVTNANGGAPTPRRGRPRAASTA